MAADVNKHLDRAKRFLEKNRVEDAIAAYRAVLEGAPQHQEATQALGDLYSRTDQPDQAAVYYGLLFDMLVDPRDENKALAIYNRFLRSGRVEQPPERIARYAFLQQRQNHAEEAIEQYTKAAELFTDASRVEDALFCLERIAQLDPENPARQLRLAEAAERISRRALAARAYLRAGQLATAHGEHEDALKLLYRAYVLAPQERSVALLYAEAKLRAGMATEAVVILDPFAGKESDAAFVDAFGKALVRAGQLDRARQMLEALLREKNVGTMPLFELADAYAAAGQERNAVDILLTLKRRMFADKKQNEFAMQMDLAGEKNPQSQGVLELWAALYNELNRESKYFEILTKLFEVYVRAGNIPKAAESLEKLVDIDPYDQRNQERLEMLRNRVDDSLFKRIAARLARSTSLSAGAPSGLHHSDTGEIVSASQTNSEAGREKQTLEDLIVQTEIFLQYSLHNKALDRLQKIGVMFPGEEKRNARLSNLYQLANWWPPGAHRQQPGAAQAGATAAPAAPPPTVTTPVPQAESPGASGAGKSGVYTAETLRDLSKISEVNQKIFRQQTPRAMLNTAVSEVGSYLRATRSLAVVGAAGRPPELTAEFCATDLKPVPIAQVALLLALMEKAEPDELGGLMVESENGSVLAELGLESALGVIITDKETQAPAGMLIVGHARRHKWRPNEAYFLQAIGDQMLMSVSHTRLRSLVRRMGVSDERTGLLSRSSYQSCLLTEADRARTQNTPLALAILQIDRGSDILRQQGESPMERFVEQLARSLQAMLRQNDVAVKYTSWSLAFILPDTTLEGAQHLADKLMRAASGLRPPWNATQITLSAGIVEATAKPEYDSEDIVTDLINRAEFSVEEARKRGGGTVIALESPVV
ncbi:MAG TPA: diguanylate cyclase [Candidatus Acidoferrum sp.]|nr:diguanylate cyclase [Candidatus Acidoferrum sp.]